MHAILRGAAIAASTLTLTLSGAAQEVSTPSTVLPPAGTELVFVNTQAILPIAPGADSAQAQFQEVLQAYDAELQSLAGELDSLLATYRQQEALLDSGGREQWQQDIQEKQRSAQERQAELERESARQRDQLLEPILVHITEVIEEIREQQGYSIVFDIAESGVVAADTSLDITAAVLERLGVDPSQVMTNPNN
jgi:outer membrane protein